MSLFQNELNWPSLTDRREGVKLKNFCNNVAGVNARTNAASVNAAIQFVGKGIAPKSEYPRLLKINYDHSHICEHDKTGQWGD